MKKTKTTTLTIRIDEARKQRLIKAAEKSYRTVTMFVEMAIDRAIAAEESK